MKVDHKRHEACHSKPRPQHGNEARHCGEERRRPHCHGHRSQTREAIRDIFHGLHGDEDHGHHHGQSQLFQGLEGNYGDHNGNSRGDDPVSGPRSGNSTTPVKGGSGDDAQLADNINDYLRQQNSPAADQNAGQLMVEYGRKYNVDPKILLAIAGQETQYGKTGVGVNGMLGVGAFDDDPDNSTRNSKYSGVENQIRLGAETFANLRDKGGVSADDSVAVQTAAVNKAGWATDPRWGEGVANKYFEIDKQIPNSTQMPGRNYQKTGGGQFDPYELAPAQKYGYDCGVTATRAALRASGFDGDQDAVLQDAVAKGFHTGAGGAWTGPDSMAKYLNSYGVDSKVEPFSQKNINEQLGEGNPIILSTNRHYFVISGQTEDGKYIVGETGKVVGKGTTMSYEELANFSGGHQLVTVDSQHPPASTRPPAQALEGGGGIAGPPAATDPAPAGGSAVGLAARDYGAGGSKNWYGLCLGWVNQAMQSQGAKIPELQAADAHGAYEQAKASGKIHYGSPPPGAIVFFPDAANGEGHVGIVNPDGQTYRGTVPSSENPTTIGDRPIPGVGSVAWMLP